MCVQLEIQFRGLRRTIDRPWGWFCVCRPCIPPYYLECGCNLPSTFPADVQQSLNEYGEAVVKALGFSYGCFHVEVMYTKDGPFLIECNARLV